VLVGRLAGGAVFAGLVLGAAGCSGDDEEPAADGGSGPGSSATEAAPVETVTTIAGLGKHFSDGKRETLKTDVNAVIDPFFDEAFLGAFPRSDFAPAFAAFTPRAAQDAEGRDLAVLTNQAIGDQIDEATATMRRVKLQVFTHDNHARGATASFTLDFDTTGTLQESRRVTGRLYLTKDKGVWQVFGYDVDEAVTL
jgi:hypothetical protein